MKSFIFFAVILTTFCGCAERADFAGLAKEMTRARNCDDVKKYAAAEMASAEASYAVARNTGNPDDMYVASRKIETAMAASRVKIMEARYAEAKKQLDERLAKEAMLKAEEEKKKQAELEEQQRIAMEKEAQLAKAQAELEEALKGIGEVTKNEKGLLVNISDILFDTGSYELKRQIVESLTRVSDTLSAYPSYKLKVEGHTDSVGPEEYNMKLSESRAKAIGDFFIAHGIGAERVSTEGFGETRPVADNSTAEGRQKNRRVEIIVSE